MKQMPAQPDSAAARPLVSVVMSNYRGAAYLGAAVASVLAQSQGALELIVADDASDDDSLDILQAAARADSRLVVISLERNRGAGGARNVALDVARGDWIALIDSDDLVHPRRIERLLAAAETTGADMIADNPVQFGAPALEGTPLVTRAISGSWRIGPADLMHSDTASSGTSSLGYLKPLIRREILGDMRYDEDLRIGEDFDLYFRLLLNGAEFRVLPDPTYLYRRHAGSVSHRLSIAALENLCDAHARAEHHARQRHGADAALDAALTQRRVLLEAALRYEHLVAAIKARKLGSAGLRLLRHPGLLGNLRTSLADRAQRRRASRAGSAEDAAPGTLVLAAPGRIAQIDAPEGAERIAVAPMRAPGTERGDDHIALAGRLARLGHARLDVIAEGLEGAHALGYLPCWRSARVLPGEADAAFALPAGATVTAAE